MAFTPEKKFEIGLGKSKKEKPKEELEISEQELKKIEEFGKSLVPSYCVLRRKEIIRSPEEFKKLYEEDKVRLTLKDTKLANLEWALKFCDINNIEGFKRLCEIYDARAMLEELSLEELSKIQTQFQRGEFEDFEFRKKISPLIEAHPIYGTISQDFLKRLRKVKGGYFAETFPTDILKQIILSLAFDYFAFKNPTPGVLERLKEKKPELYQKVSDKEFSPSDLRLTRKTIRAITDPTNSEYLRDAKLLGILFDPLGILGEKDLKKIKDKVYEIAEEMKK